MKLELEHLAPYLPYKLKAEIIDYKCDYVGIRYDEIIGLHQWSKNGDWCLLTNGGSKPSLDKIKPILRNLSDLTKEIEVNREKFVPTEKLYKDNYINIEAVVGEDLRVYCFLRDTVLTKSIWDMPYEIVMQMIEWHFNVFNLPENLYVDINTI